MKGKNPRLMSILNAHHPLITPHQKFQTSLLTEGDEEWGVEVALGIRERKKGRKKGEMKGRRRRVNEKERKEERRQSVKASSNGSTGIVQYCVQCGVLSLRSVL